jgi:PAS domain S-box-containing protein
VRLLIAERSENAAYQFDSLLRDAGIATRLEIVDLPMAVDKLPQADMMLCNAALPELHQLLPRLSSTAPSVPIIVVNNDEASLTQSEGMELGAADVVSDMESRHLVLVVKRELEHVCQNIQYRRMHKALNEAEQRCQLLLQSSRAAIAYVHEGMHIYANEGYLKLFGFEDADELLGLPLIDLLDGDSAALLKDQLKQFRNAEQETDFDFTGHSTDGAVINGNITLAVAEYEGEDCLQVTVRVEAGTADVVMGEADSDESEVPVLMADAIIDEISDHEISVANGGPELNTNGADHASAMEESFEDPGDGTAGEFELELEDDQAADPLANDADREPVAMEATSKDETFEQETVVEAETAFADAEPTTETAAPELEHETLEFSLDAAETDDATLIAVDVSPDAENELAIVAAETQEVAPEITEESEATVVTATTSEQQGAVASLGEFLSQCESAASANVGQFTSIFVAQIDNYEGMQRTFGLGGVEGACRTVASRLLREVSGPFMQISPHQWAMLVCDQTREDALAQVEAYRKAIESMMFEVREKTVRPSCTFGGAILNTESSESTAGALEETLNNAFTTLRTTLESSEGNTVHLPKFETADQEYDDEANRVLLLISEAIENQSFTLLFQPIISLRGDSDEHYEVFLRMSDREGCLLAPGDFLRTAIDNGVAGKIDRWVILQSIKMLSAHRANGHNTRLTLNLTSNSVADPEFIQWLGVAIKAARLPSDAVIFQITEQDASTYIRQTREFVEGLKNLHCRSSLSRFGLEPDPFEILSHIPVDFVKLDGSLVKSVEEEAEQKESVKEMICELQNAGKLTIVPMVESASLVSTLWQVGVNYIQGHYLQEPSTSMDYDFSTDD